MSGNDEKSKKIANELTDKENAEQARPDVVTPRRTKEQNEKDADEALKDSGNKK